MNQNLTQHVVSKACRVVPSSLALVADIGGTNARFALADLDGDVPVLQRPQTLATADFASLQHAAEHYLAAVGVAPRRAAIAVACPVVGDEVRLTNRAWAFSRRELQQRLGLETLRVLNDFGAVAWAVPALAESERVVLHGPPAAPVRAPISVIGPGTGLGVALLVADGAHGWQVIETEGGHASFAPQDAEERLIAQWLERRHGRVSNERVLSGQGLAAIDAVLRGVASDAGEVAEERVARDAATAAGGAPRRTLREPAQIVAAALEGHDVAARRALAGFCAILGSVAGDAALLHGARTVAIAGGIVPRFIGFVRSSAFRERFLAKGRFAAYLEAVTVEVVTHAMPGLLGAALALRHTIAPQDAP